MLVSHGKHFIFTKTRKTAGTSVESYFEPYCILDEEWQPSDHRDEYVSAGGIIGYRGTTPNRFTYHAHMPAKTIRDLIGKDAWQRYFKFTVIRNPFDKLVSFYFWRKRAKWDRRFTHRLKTFTTRVLGLGHRSREVEEAKRIEHFRSWISRQRVVPDRDTYFIDGEVCVDYFIRFEALHYGVKHVCDRLSIPFEPARLPEFKTGVRPNDIPVAEYYDREAEQIVRETYAWEFDQFGYSMPK